MFNRSFWLVLCLGSLCLGCGKSDTPDVGLVSGKVTLDGEPIEGASVEFTPITNVGQRTSTATTSSDGSYRLAFSASTLGAALGEHDVVITKTDTTAKPTANGYPLLTPEKYAQPGALKATVEPGENTIDFEITSK